MKKQLVFGVVLVGIAALIFFLFTKLNRSDLFVVMDVPSFQLTNQDHQIISEKDMKGKVYLVEFFFTNCPTICPVMKHNLLEIQKEVNHPDFGVISITIDPKRDTPEKLKDQRNRFKIQNPNWHFLTGDRDYIYKLSQEFNIYVGEDQNTTDGLNHSGKFALVDRNGKIRSRYDEKGMPILYYSGINYSDPEGKVESLAGEYHPQVEWVKEDILKLLSE